MCAGVDEEMVMQKAKRRVEKDDFNIIYYIVIVVDVHKHDNQVCTGPYW